jgi:hypothetical protein
MKIKKIKIELTFHPDKPFAYRVTKLTNTLRFCIFKCRVFALDSLLTAAEVDAVAEDRRFEVSIVLAK